MSILVTGGTGYIGSHTCVELIQAGYDVVILDDLSNSKAEVVDKIEKITGTRPVFYETTMMDLEGVRQIFRENRIDAVIHLDRKSTRLNSSHEFVSRMPSSA